MLFFYTYGCFLLTMLSFLFSRSFCHGVLEVNRVSCPASSSLYRSFTSSQPACSEVSGDEVAYEQLVAMLSKHAVQLFDVRNPDEYQAGRIPQAVNIPLDRLEESLKLSPKQFEKKFHVSMPKKDDKDIVFHCKTGRRSATALDIARQLGYSRVRHYKGGYSEWAEKEEL